MLVRSTIHHLKAIVSSREPRSLLCKRVSVSPLYTMPAKRKASCAAGAATAKAKAAVPAAPADIDQTNATVVWLQTIIEPQIREGLSKLSQDPLPLAGVQPFTPDAFASAMAADGFYECTLTIKDFDLYVFPMGRNCPAKGAVNRLGYALMGVNPSAGWQPASIPVIVSSKDVAPARGGLQPHGLDELRLAFLSQRA
jgi:hypothetical protein